MPFTLGGIEGQNYSDSLRPCGVFRGGEWRSRGRAGLPSDSPNLSYLMQAHAISQTYECQLDIRSRSLTPAPSRLSYLDE